jgi:trehalose/maltose hydrolase-like predicted phosphorylase
LYSILYGTKDQEVARNLLTYRYNQLDKALKMQRIRFYQWCSLVPYGNMNGEECHQRMGNHFEEIHRNGAIVLRYTITIDTRVTIAIFPEKV